MENLIFSLNATLPVFGLMLLGIFFRKIGWMEEGFAAKINSFVFRAALPALLFSDLATVDFQKSWDTSFVLYCFGATLLCILLAFLFSCFLRDRSIQGEFIQASYRSSAALLGIALIQNIYGNAGMAPLMIIGSVPLYNVMAVVVLALFRPQRSRFDRAFWKKTGLDVIKNPILIGILAGLLWSLLRIPMPAILGKITGSLGNVATPMGLITMGASFQGRKAMQKAKPAAAASFLKLIGFAAIFLPAAVLCGFRQEALVAVLIMLGSPTTVSGFVMARNMGHEGVLTASVVMLTTLLSAFTITAWIYLLRCLALI